MNSKSVICIAGYSSVDVVTIMDGFVNILFVNFVYNVICSVHQAEGNETFEASCFLLLIRQHNFSSILLFVDLKILIISQQKKKELEEPEEKIVKMEDDLGPLR